MPISRKLSGFLSFCELSPSGGRGLSRARGPLGPPALLLILALPACALVSPYSGGFEELRARTIVIHFPASEQDLDRICNAVSGSWLPTHGCAVIADSERTARLMGNRFRAIGQATDEGIECILIVPPSAAIVEHELGLCASKAEGYWNAHRTPL